MSQFGIQMYTLRETMKTPEDYETTLRRVAEMGYTNVQLTPPAFSGAEDTQRLLEKYGLAADSAICGVYQIPERLDQIEKDAKTLKTDVVRTDSIRPEDRGDTEGYKRFAAHLNLCGAELKRRGLEFTRIASEFFRVRTSWAMFAALTFCWGRQTPKPCCSSRTCSG